MAHISVAAQSFILPTLVICSFEKFVQSLDWVAGSCDWTPYYNVTSTNIKGLCRCHDTFLVSFGSPIRSHTWCNYKKVLTCSFSYCRYFFGDATTPSRPDSFVSFASVITWLIGDSVMFISIKSFWSILVRTVTPSMIGFVSESI